MTKIAIIGAGAWGTALAAAAQRAGSDVTIWAYEKDVVESINQNHENTVFLPTISLDPSIRATSDFADIQDAEVIYLVVPAQFVEAICEELKQSGIKETIPFVLCSKGITQKRLLLMSELVAGVLANPLLALSGPTFAEEVAKGFPASATLSGKDPALVEIVISSIASDVFKLYPSDDIIGCQIAGAVKNVLAIACGILQGKQLGENAIAALITKGLQEMQTLCVAKGGNPTTLMKLCGIGDVLLTCNSAKSRNTSLGISLGEGQTLESILRSRRSVAEGVASSKSVVALAESLTITMPICETVARVLHGECSTDQAVHDLVRYS